jgi:hypothetical protein
MARDITFVRSRAERAYEAARLKYALLGCLPVTLLVISVCAFGNRTRATVGLACAIVAFSILFLWRGLAARKAVLPGSFAGLIPFGLALIARGWGHVCTGTGCVSFCVPACACGGLLAGLFIARVGRTATHPVRFFASAAVLASLVGALGCSCVGFSGVIGLIAGLGCTLVPKALLQRRA